MDHQLPYKNSTGRNQVTLPTEFIAVCVIAIIGCLSATIYFCRSMSGGMEMPGGWIMSMMWMRMPGQTWPASFLIFLIMWLAMMVAMMMPSALPMFLKTRRQWASLCYMAFGYFAIWLVAGVGIYVLGMTFGIVTMRWELISRAVPWLSGALLTATGLIQFTSWKMTHLLRCRSSSGCGISCPENQTSFRLGCKQGIACCACCAAPITIQLILGIMNPLAMIAVAIIIAAEKLLPRPKITARIAGAAAIFAGITMIIIL